MAATKTSYAIISVGGKQYRVREGERLLVDRLKTDEGKTFNPDVLFLGGDGDGTLSPRTQVTAKVVGHVLGDKIRTRQAAPEVRLQEADRLPGAPFADRDPVDRRHREADYGRNSRGTRAGSAGTAGETRAEGSCDRTGPGCLTRSGSPAARLRGLHGCGHRREVQALED